MVKRKPVMVHPSMRGKFAHHLHLMMKKNESIWLVTGDLGYGMFDKIKKDFPNRFINVGAAEQVLVGLGVGLSLMGKLPVLYSITPFLLYRPFETIRNYVNHEKIPVLLAGGGRNRDYAHDGFSHWAEEDKQVMKLFENISSHWPKKKEGLPRLLRKYMKEKIPMYINLER